MLVWIIFIVAILAFMVIDLGVFNRRAHVQEPEIQSYYNTTLRGYQNDTVTSHSYRAI